jgi:hypothetical protein
MSTIKVDTYLTRGGASEIAIDKLKGASSAGSMTVVGEGGSTTTNLQQGLAKMWCTHSQASSYTLDDSFNVASIADNGLGETTITFTSSPSNANYSVTQGSNNSNRMLISNAPNTTRVKCEVYEIDAANNPGDASDVCTTVHGDLA